MSVAVCAGCKSQGGNENSIAAPAPGIVDAGPANKYDAPGIYSDFRQQGFFVIRRDQKLMALSSTCTHNGCKLNVAADQSFFCKCHGSVFDPNGKVEQGPAEDDLPVLPTRVDDRGHLLVNTSAAQAW